ncbi:hypothetical protein ACFX1S_034769 [Malus domestica]
MADLFLGFVTQTQVSVLLVRNDVDMHWNDEITGHELKKMISTVCRETVMKIGRVWVENNLGVLLSCIVVVGGLNLPKNA